MELALVLLPLALVVFTAIDFGVRASHDNRLRAAAREGAAVAQYSPWRVQCSDGDEDIRGRIIAQNPSLSNLDVRVVAHPDTPQQQELTGCTATSPSSDPGPGDRVAVEVSTEHNPISLISGAFLDSTVVARVTVLVQG